MHSWSICVNRTVGEVLAVSLAQGGPSPTFFSPWSYSYLCGGKIDLNSSAVEDQQLRELIAKVCHALCIIENLDYVKKRKKCLGMFFVEI